MSDLLSVTGGVVGIISLGIQLCQEIASYKTAWQAYDEDIGIIGLKAEELRVPLKRLRDIVEEVRLTDPEIAACLNEKASCLQRQTERLKRSLDQYKPFLHDGSIGKIRNKLKKAAYPIAGRDTLRNMTSDMDSMQTTIQTTLAILNTQWAKTREARDEKILILIQEMHLTMRSILAGTMPAPGLLQKFCDLHTDISHTAHISSQMAAENGNEECISNDESQFSRQYLSISVRQSKRRARAAMVERCYQYQSQWLSRMITFSFSLSTGAGGFSIAPVLRMQALLGRDSQVNQKLSAFNTFNHLWIPFFDGNLDHLIDEFQKWFSNGEATPSDMLSWGGFEGMEVYPLVDSFTPVLKGQKIFTPALSGPNLRSVYRFVRFLIECGSIPDNSCPYGVLDYLCSEVRWGEHEHTFASHLIEMCGPINFLPRTRLAKINMRFLVSREEDSINCPSIGKIILRESEEELRKALRSGLAHPDDKVKDRTLLELAIGWPIGVQMLLEFGADACAIYLGSAPYSVADTEDGKCEAYCDSIKPLLEAGCNFDVFDIFCCRSKTVRLLLIQELAKRRRQLWELAQACLPARSLGGFCTRKDAIVDSQAFELQAQLLIRGWEIHQSLRVHQQDESLSVYHCKAAFPEASDELYRAGFRDIDLPDVHGLTPLMLFGSTPCVRIPSGQRKNVEMRIWLVSKGANLARKLPRSNATVAHRISSVMVEHVFRVTCSDYITGTKTWPKFEAIFSEHMDTVFLAPSIQDGCVCACSLGGCTTLSVAFRKASSKVAREFRGLTLGVTLGERQRLFRKVYRLIILWTESRPGVDQAIIRFLTFEGLQLRHTCCIEIDKRPDTIWEDARDRSEMEHIWEEDEHGLHELEQLVSEFEFQFKQNGLPITEFLDLHWHTGMINFLSRRGLYDEDYHTQTRNLGVFLTKDGNNIPEVVNWFGVPIEELNSEVSTEIISGD